MLPVLIVNLKSRTDRRIHIKKELSEHDEFRTSVVDTVEHESGAIGLSRTMQKNVNRATKMDWEYFILCEDDHQFTKHYNYEILQKSINEVQEKRADILCGGGSWFKTGLQNSKKLFWVEKFSGVQFTIKFKRFYQKILDVEVFDEHNAADYKLSGFTGKKFVIYPFISVQKDFGYSDVTPKNIVEGRVEKLFESALERLDLLNKIRNYYSAINIVADNLGESETGNIVIPLYSIIEKTIHQPGNVMSSADFEQMIVEVDGEGVQQAQRNNDDFIITFDHIALNSSFKKPELFNNIISANNYGSELLLGNIEMFNHAVPITNNLFWVDSFSYSSFIALFSPIFLKVISASPSDNEDIYSYFSYLTSHKLVLYPFIADIKATGMKKPGFQEKGNNYQYTGRYTKPME